MIETPKAIEVKTGFDQLTEKFISNLDVAESSRKTYARTIKQFFTWLEENATPGNITKQDILNYKESLITSKKSANTVTGYINTVKKFFDWMESEGLYKNVAKGIKGTKRSNNFKKDALTIPQTKKLLESIRNNPGKNTRERIKNKRDFAMINLMIRTGLRTIELERANVEDIRQEAGKAVLYIQGKGHFEKDERVILNHSTLDPIMEYLHARKALPIKTKEDEKKGPPPLFMSHANNSNGERITTRSIRRATMKHMGESNISSPRITSHSLRHTAVTFVLLGGGSIQEAQTLARHKSIDTTMIYAHNIDRMKNAPENRIDALLEGGQA